MKHVAVPLTALATLALVVALAPGASPAAVQQLQPPGGEVPISVTGPVRLTYRFEAGRQCVYYNRVEENEGPWTGSVMVVAEAVKAPSSLDASRAEPARMRYSFRFVAGERPAAGGISLLVSQSPDGALGDRGTADGKPIPTMWVTSEKFFPTEEIRPFTSAMRMLVLPDHFYNLVLPQTAVRAGSTWTEQVELATTTPPGKTFDPAAPLRRTPFRCQYTVTGFAKWNGHNCAKIDLIFVDEPKQSQPESTFYFDYENGELAGAVFADRSTKKPTEVTWLAAVGPVETLPPPAPAPEPTGAAGSAPVQAIEPPAEESPITVAGPVALAYEFEAGQDNSYFLNLTGLGAGGAAPLFGAVRQEVLSVKRDSAQGAVADSRYSFVVFSEGKAGIEELPLLADQHSDGLLSNLRTGDGKPIEDWDFTAVWGLRFWAAMATLVASDHLANLALPDKPASVGDSWTATIQRMTGFSGKSDSPAFSIERAPVDYRYTLAGFVKWNNCSCAKIDAVVTDPPETEPFQRTLYFDYQKGALVGYVAVERGGARSGLWMVTQPEMPSQLETGKVLVGAGLLSKSVFLEAPALGPVTDIVTDKSSPLPQGEIGIAGSRGATFVDLGGHPKQSVTFDAEAGYVDIIDVDGDGVPEYLNRGAGWSLESSLLDHSGKTLWRCERGPGVDDMAAGDLDGKGRLSFVVGYNGDGGVQRLDQQGRVQWRQPEGNVWHVEIADTNGDGRNEIVHSNARGEITILNGQGWALRRTSPPFYFSQFSLCSWPSKKDRKVLLAADDDQVWLVDFDAAPLARLSAPLSRGAGSDARGTPVSLKAGEPDYLAVLVNFDRWERAILYLYDAKETLVYEEVLPTACASIAAVALQPEATETLLVGGNGKVWHYAADKRTAG